MLYPLTILVVRTLQAGIVIIIVDAGHSNIINISQVFACEILVRLGGLQFAV
jgi:hypothetical protein